MTHINHKCCENPMDYFDSQSSFESEVDFKLTIIRLLSSILYEGRAENRLYIDIYADFMSRNYGI